MWTTDRLISKIESSAVGVVCGNIYIVRRELRRVLEDFISSIGKSEAAHKVLSLMDEDLTYCEALEKVLSENAALNRDELEKELDLYI